MEGWPPLAWLARCGPDSVELRHGSMVETQDGFGVEGCWAGDFAAGDFDRSAVVAGSGVRVRDGGATFVPPTSTVDRLAWLALDDGTHLISNSLFAPLAASGAALREDKAVRYKGKLASISRGLTDCADSLKTSLGRLRLTYFHNLVWDGRSMEPSEKPAIGVALGNFGEYRSFLAGGFSALAANMADPRRSDPLAFLGTLSSGYDANACTALAAEAGCASALCFETNARGRADSGVPVAEALGIEPVLLGTDDWRAEPEMRFYPEAPFIAVGRGSGLVGFHGAGPRLRGAVLVTGFYGDSIWNPDWDRLGPDIVRKDASGLGLSEYRLHAGFVNCAATFWAAREVADVVAIARSDEMRDWVAGEEYSRPVPRRIAEEAGVPREAFGQRKSAVTRLTPHRDPRFMRPASMRDFVAWLHSNRPEPDEPRLRVRPRLDRALVRWRRALVWAHGLALSVPGYGRTSGARPRHARLKGRAQSPTPLRERSLWWAIERCCDAYSQGPSAT